MLRKIGRMQQSVFSVSRKNAAERMFAFVSKRKSGSVSIKQTAEMLSSLWMLSIMRNRQRKTVGAEWKHRRLFRKGKKPNKITCPPVG